MLNLVVFVVVSAGILFASRGPRSPWRAGVAGLYQPVALELLLILALLQGPHWFEAPFSALEAVSALLLALTVVLGVAAWLGRAPAWAEAAAPAESPDLEAAMAGAVADPAALAEAVADPAVPGQPVADPVAPVEAVADPAAPGKAAQILAPGKAPTSSPAHGIYRAIRHPAYAALLCFGWGVLCQGLARVDAIVFLGACLLTCASLLLIAAARAREAELYARLGTPYTDYLKATKLFIPFLF